MAYRNTITVNIREMGAVKNSCLANTRKAAAPDIPVKYNTAWEAEQNTTLHAGTPPGGVWVPVFFSYYATIRGEYKNWGHVGWYKDGAFYSDGVKFASIADYQAHHSPRYVGWGESLNGVQVVEYVPDPKPAAKKAAAKRLYFAPIGQTVTFYKESGGTFAMKIKDASYNWNVLEDHGNYVVVSSASAGGRCRVYLKYTATGKPIPGRYIK